MINLLGIILTAYASHYSDGVMQQVLHNRQVGNAWVSLPLELPHYVGLIAVRDCEHLGEVWWIRPAGWQDQSWEPHLVIDCARPAWYDNTQAWMDTNHVMVETSYPTALRWGTVGEWTAIERLFTERDLRYGPKAN